MKRSVTLSVLGDYFKLEAMQYVVGTFDRRVSVAERPPSQSPLMKRMTDESCDFVGE
ncbi:MAG UNVERIFIED_CONTAM: hypothetical protein LVT10_21625 [Anaerolineae bacterium]